MTRHIAFLGLFVTLSSLNSLACDCAYNGPFLKMAQHTNFVALIKVEKYLTFREVDKMPLSMEVEIIDVYKGKESRKRIKVWGDDGLQCREYLSTFKEGQYYVIAFYSSTYDSEKSGEKKSDYFISSCGAYWLSADLNTTNAKGDVDSKNRTERLITLPNLELEIKKSAANIGLPPA